MATRIKPKAALYTIISDGRDSYYEIDCEEAAHRIIHEFKHGFGGYYPDYNGSNKQFTKLVEDARNNKFQIVIVHAFDVPFPDSASILAQLFAMWEQGIELVFS